MHQPATKGKTIDIKRNQLTFNLCYTEETSNNFQYDTTAGRIFTWESTWAHLITQSFPIENEL